jgi:chloramphenicol-sensitive protein RarD
LSPGIVYALLAYLAWGLAPLFWRELKGVPALEVLAYRVVGSALVFTALALARKSTRREFGQLLKSRKGPWKHLPPALLITLNWSIYVAAVLRGEMVEASLGYFINPLLNVVLGAWILREVLDSATRWAVGFAGFGVLLMAGSLGRPPWIALILAVSFALYGLLRKRAPTDAVVSSAVESLWMVPLALGFLILGGGTWNHSVREWVFLGLGGVITALPLLCFVQAARRLPLSKLGFFQYLSPTLQFTIGVVLFHEPVLSGMWISFGFIWFALGLLTGVSLVRSRRK